MSPADLLPQVQEIIGRVFGVPPDSVTRDLTALDVSGWDSVTHVYLLMEIEQTLGARIPEDRIYAMENVGELIDILVGLLQPD